ncbi:CPBP family intramembrane metalloprotease [bacterium]|nr:MAG: CPBP family intramembrane metalloprotease [bacterium]
MKQEFSFFKDFFVNIFRPKNLMHNVEFSSMSEKLLKFSGTFFLGQFITFFVAVFQLTALAIIAFIANFEFQNQLSIRNDIFGDPSRLLNDIIILLLGLLFIVIIAPIFEELIFRLHLKNDKTQQAISFALFVSYFLIPITGGFLFKRYTSLSQTNISIIILLVGILTFLFLFVFLKYIFFDLKFVNSFITNLYTKYFFVPFYLSVIIFGLIHILNYKPMPWYLYLFIPIITLTQLWLGYLFGYIRMRYGMIYSIVAHVLHNFAIVIVIGTLVAFLELLIT